MVTTGVPASRRNFSSGLSSAASPGLRVIPNAASPGALQRLGFQAGEELRVFGDRAGPAALDVVDPEGVEAASDPQLVLDGEADAFHLGAVAQGGVVEKYFHGVTVTDSIGRGERKPYWNFSVRVFFDAAGLPPWRAGSHVQRASAASTALSTSSLPLPFVSFSVWLASTSISISASSVPLKASAATVGSLAGSVQKTLSASRSLSSAAFRGLS